ncbi:MAG: 50S ribosomal protein L24 [Planctomycetes bacterium]|nr:50S ribosomal protein L24 [Planctomycetota bacterium]
MHIKSGDIVEVMAGDDKKVKGKVLHIDRDKGKITVEGVGRVYKHVRRSQRNPQGGRLSKEMPIQISNVLLVCPKCNKGVRTGVKLLDSGVKQRVCKKCDASLGEISKSKKKAAAK